MEDKALRTDLLRSFRWINGHADIWPFFTDRDLLARTVEALAEPYRAAGITKVAGIESRGFLLGGTVARELDAGFVAIRKEGGIFPGEKLERRTAPDYRSRRILLCIRRASVGPTDRVILVDDWLETGGQAATARALIEECGGEFVGMSVIVDELPPELRPEIDRYHALLRAEDLGDSSFGP